MNRAVLLAALGIAVGCGNDRLTRSALGTLEARVSNAGAGAKTVGLTVRCESDSRDASADVSDPTTTLDVPELSPGICEARVATFSAAGQVLRSVWVSNLLIVGGQTTQITVDLADGVAPLELCNGIDDNGDGVPDEPSQLAICAQCNGNIEVLAADDSRCPAIDCSAFFSYEKLGTAQSGFTCWRTSYANITDKRCAAIGSCLSPGEQTCKDHGSKSQQVALALGVSDVCHTVEGCSGQTPPSLGNQPDGTPCGTQKVCRSGQCVASGQPDTGCADGSREGFQSLGDYPTIASCSGGFSVGGVTRANLVPTCNRQAGNDGANKEGTGCSAADLCASGWHVCLGKTEVGAKAGANGCRDSVPAGSPDKSMFFAVAQHSQSLTVCDDASGGDNDVFGCGNLGVQLTGGNNCGVLTRALASTQAGRCGYNEAEPNLGPWQCPGGAGSDLHEGANVTKAGCPNQSCTWNGAPTGNWDRGGVLCCKD